MGKIISILFQNQKPYQRINISIRVFFIIQVLKDKCMQIAVQRRLKGGYSNCSTMFDPQQLDYQPILKRNILANS